MIVRVFEKRIVEIQRQSLEVINEIFGGSMEFGVRNPKIWRRSIFSNSEAAWPTSADGRNAAVVKGLPDFPAITVSEFQDSGLRSSFSIDEIFNSRQEQKPSEHEVTKHRIFITISPERPSRMGAASGDLESELLDQFGHGQVCRGQVALEDDRTSFRKPTLKDARQKIANTSQLRFQSHN